MNFEINISNATIIVDTSDLIFMCFRRVPHFFIDIRFAASLALFYYTGQPGVLLLRGGADEEPGPGETGAVQ